MLQDQEAGAGVTLKAKSLYNELTADRLAPASSVSRTADTVARRGNQGASRHAAAIILLAVSAGCSGPQTDARMQSRYEGRKTSFHELVMGTTCHIEKGKIVWRHEAATDNAACSALLAKVEADGVGIDPMSGGVMIIPSQRGDSSRQKGYIFSPTPLAPLYPSLDEHPVDLQPYQMGFKQIDKNWYITYEYLN